MCIRDRSDRAKRRSLMKTTRIALIGLLACGSSLPFLIGADGGCGAFTSTTPAPDVTGKWAISYGNTIAVKVTIGGSVYSQNLSASGGNFSITHQGKPYSFNLDCARPEVVCPSEVWPSTIDIDQRDAMYKHRMWVKIPTQQCSGMTMAPQASQCGSCLLYTSDLRVRWASPHHRGCTNRAARCR